MQMAFTDAMAEKPEATDIDDDTIQTFISLAAKLKEADPEGYRKFIAALTGNPEVSDEDADKKPATLSTDAKALADRIGSDEAFKREVSEAAHRVKRRIAAVDASEKEAKNQAAFESRWGNRIKVDNIGVQKC